MNVYLRGLGLLSVCLAQSSPSLADDYHVIAVLDKADNSPISGVRIRTKHHASFTSDDNGIIAFYEPGLMDQNIHFSMKRDGYTLSHSTWAGGTQIKTTQNVFSVLYLDADGEPPALSIGTRETDHLNEGLPTADDYFEVQFIDQETGEGVPLVTLTVDLQTYVTDNAGRIAFYESKYMGDEVSVSLATHGYTVPETLTLEPTSGGQRVIAITRDNLAVRQVRLTGAGLYADSIRLGYEDPLPNSLNNGHLSGQDTVMVSPYRGELFWIWGDTLSLHNALGNFRAAGATSTLPEPFSGVPEAGIDYQYFEDDNGFTAQMAPDSTVPGTGATWIGQLFTLDNEDGEENLYAHYGRYGAGLKMTEHGMVVYNDDLQVFEELVDWGLEHSSHGGKVNSLTRDGQDYLYVGSGVRIPANVDAIQDPTQWEVFTAFDNDTTSIKERDEQGRPVYSWSANNIIPTNQHVNEGVIEADEILYNNIRDAFSGTPFLGTPHIQVYNPHRNRWIALIQERWGTGPSFAGETWYAEADTPMGPWTYGKKVVSHDNYTFYNVQLHPWFDKDNGKTIHFEATYTHWLTSSEPTPRYNYNQILYRLDLDNTGLGLPVPVYTVGEPATHPSMVTRNGLHPEMKEVNIAFMAPEIETDLATIPVYWEGSSCEGHRLKIGGQSNATPQFFLIDPALGTEDGVLPPQTIPVYQTINPDTAEIQLQTLEEGTLVGYAWENVLNISFPVIQNLGPLHAHAGPDVCVQETEENTGVAVLLDGTGSIHQENSTYNWTWEGGSATGPVVEVVLPAGIHDITLNITDADQRVQRDHVIVDVEPTHADTDAPEDTDDTETPGPSGGCSTLSSVPALAGSWLALLLVAGRRRLDT